jgi:hypothetical protein
MEIELEEGEEPETTPVTHIGLVDPAVFEVEEEEEPQYKRLRCQSPVPGWISSLLSSAENLYNAKIESRKEKELRARKELIASRKRRDEQLAQISKNTRKRSNDGSNEQPFKRQRISETLSPFHT